MICSGANTKPFVPAILGLHSDFGGKVMHMHAYRTNDEFVGKTVLVVGDANSAGDVASDISHVAKQVRGLFSCCHGKS